MRHTSSATRTLKCALYVYVILLCASIASAQSTITPSKRALATRVADGAIHVDGQPDESLWEQIPAIVDFVQKEPVENAAPTEPMDIRVAYDSSALYIGVRMHKKPGAPIQTPMGRRDRLELAESLLVALDTFRDRRTAYVFGVTASGVRIDRFHPEDNEAVFDEGFNPVWEARTSVDELGWTTELWIPFSQLRFTGAVEQVWGLNIRRSTPTLEEHDYWMPIPRTATAWSSRFVIKTTFWLPVGK